jgi:hypothetical protein
MEIQVTFEELALLLSKALNTEVTQLTFIPEEKMILRTNLDLLGIRKPAPALEIIPTLYRPEDVPEKAPISPSYPEASPEEMAEIVAESLKLEGVVFEYTHDGEMITRKRNESETNLPPGEPIVYVRGDDDE